MHADSGDSTSKKTATILRQDPRPKRLYCYHLSTEPKLG